MARSIVEETEEGLRDPINEQALNAMILAGLTELLTLQKQIQDRQEEYVEPLKRAFTKRFRALKKDTTIPRKVLNLYFKQMQLADEARAIEDVNERTTLLMHMSTVYKALPLGETADWLAVLEAGDAAVEESRPKRPARPGKKAAANEG